MVRKEIYETRNPYETPEPHGKPGYTGYFPESGPKRIFQKGKAYEWMTYDQMEHHPVAGLRFGFILQTDEGLKTKLEDEVLAWKHEKTTQDVKFRRDMLVGYTGHVPQRKFLYGKSYSKECKSAIALLEKLKLADQ